ncbi:MAG: hypothetical protein EON59_14010 [Alphaproteobacteria bacterium]|nr:MAG: hypothetical protein EON59_14010 [Alphaproteobacteria bacterium]
MYVAKSAFCLALFAFANSASAQSLWHEAQSGMSPAQIEALFPAAAEPDDKSRYGDDTICELRIADFEYTGTKFGVCFLFKDRSLVQVQLKADPFNRQMVGAVFSALKEEFGAPAEGETLMCNSLVLLSN